MENPSMDTVHQAIIALYGNPNTTEKEKASKWLGEVQKSIHSWKIADELLQQNESVQSCWFAAQTMRAKVQHNLSELPPESLVSLRDSLLTHLESSQATPAIVTQLSLALADLALQMPSWQNFVSDIIKVFSNNNDFVLLEVLTVFPQEIDSSNLKLGENRREEVKAELRANSQTVMLFLKECLNRSQNSQVALKVIKCMTSWVQVKAMNVQEIPQNAVIGLSFQVLRDCNSINLLHEAAADCLCATLHCLEDNNNNDEVEQLLFNNISALEECYHMAVAHEEDVKATHYARVFTEMAETFLEKIVLSVANGSMHFSIRSLDLCLVCVGHHDYEIAEVTFNLWYKLSEEVYERDYQPLTDAFKPYIERLIEALARHCQCEPDHTHLPDEGDDFYEFRMKVMELIKDVVFIVGSSSVFRQMFSTLQSDLPWEQTEAALFVMQAVAKNILPEEYEYVPKVVEAILSMPEGTHRAVRKTCILLLGELCEWIERHPECLEPCLQLLIRALHDENLAHAAATALQNICKACRTAAVPHVSQLMAAARLADELNLPLHTSATLVRALAAALGRLPPQQLAVGMREAAGAQLAGLREALRRGGEPVPWLDRLAALFRDVDAPPAADHPCLPAFNDAWPLIDEVLTKYGSSSRVCERACRCVRFAVRACGRAAAAALPALAAALPAHYQAAPHSCLLYLAAVLIDALAAPDTTPHLVTLATALLPRALHTLAPPEPLREHPDTLDDVFRLCIRCLQRMPLAFLQVGAAPAVLQCAARAAAVDHRDANSSVMKFLFDFIKLANTTRPEMEEAKGLANEVVKTYGEELTYALLEASVLHLHSYMLSEVAEVVVELNIWQRRQGVEWVGAALLRLPSAPPAPTEHQKRNFHQLLLRTEKYKEVTKLLRDFARLYR